jgi:nicotinate-nucleotide adenylyltransferase
LAQEALTAFNLQQVRFIPAGQPPHRGAPGVSAQTRLEMVRMACAGHANFMVDDREVASAEPSYTVNTLATLRAECGAAQPLCLLLGADAFLGLTTWHRWQALFGLAHVLVAQRPGFPQSTWTDNMPQALQQELHARQTLDSTAVAIAPAGRILTFTITALDIAASHIRVALKRNASPRYLLPDAVLNYISQNQLYSE